MPISSTSRVGKLPGDELQQEQRALVRPVQIVQDEHERPGATRSLQEARDRVEEAKASLLGIGASEKALRRSGSRSRTSGTSSAISAAPGPSSVAQLLGADGRGHRTAAPAPTASREARLPPPSSGPRAPRRRASRARARQLLRETALPDPRLSADDHEPSAAGERRRRARPGARRARAPARRRRFRAASERRRVGRCGPRLTGGREEVERGILPEDRLLELLRSPGPARGRAPRRARASRPGRPAEPRPGGRSGTGRASAARAAAHAADDGRRAPRARRRAPAWRPSARSASIRSSSAATCSSSSRAISSWANESKAKSASGGPRQRASASRRSVDASCGSSPPARPAALREQRREAIRVELSVLEPEHVAGRSRQQDAAAGIRPVSALVAEHLAQPGDVPLHDLRRRRRRRLAPELVDQTIGRDDLVRVQEEHGQEGTLLPRSRPPAGGPAARPPADRGRETRSTPRFGLGRT